VAQGPLYLTTPPCPPTRERDLDLALEVVGADAFARYHRLCGRDVRLVAAALEQGRGVERAAYERGGTPEDLAEQWAEQWQATLKALDVAYQGFARTTELRHQRVVKAFFLKLFDQGDIYKGTHEGAYCPHCEDFFPGEQPAEGQCPVCHETLTEAAEEAYFLRTSKYQKAVVEQLEARSDFIHPSAHQEAVLRSVEATGMPDRCISRPRRGWAVPVPIDTDQAIEVWFDALISYLTTSGYLADPQMFERYWPPCVQIVTAEALASHALAWPAVLMAAGLPLPERLFVRGRLGLEGGEAAKPATKDTAALVDRIGADAVRYALLGCTDYAADGTLSLRDAVEACNEDLTDRLARLVETTLGAIEQLCDGQLPRPGPLGAAEEELAKDATSLFPAIGSSIEMFDFGPALERAWHVVDEALRYAEEMGVAEPRGEAIEPRRLNTALYVLAETCRLIAHGLQPFLPGAAAAIHDLFGVRCEGQEPAAHSQWGLTQPESRVRRSGAFLPRLAVPTD